MKLLNVIMSWLIFAIGLPFVLLIAWDKNQDLYTNVIECTLAWLRSNFGRDKA